MPYGFVQQKASAFSAGPSATFDAGPVAGDLMLASVLNNVSTSQPTVSDANGNWSLLNSVTRTGASLWLFGKRADVSQPAAVTAVRSTDVLFMQIYEFSGGPFTFTGIVDGTPGAVAGAGTAATTSGSQPSTTSVLPGDLVFTQLATTNTITGPTAAGLTAGLSGPSGAVQLADAYNLLGAPATTYNPSWAWTTSRNWLQLTTLLKRRQSGIML